MNKNFISINNMSQANLQNSLCKIKLETLNFSLFSKSTLKGDLILARNHIELKKLGVGIGHFKQSCSIQSKVMHEKSNQTPKMTIFVFSRAPKFKP